MVKSANMNGLLDSDSDSLSSCQHRVKARLHEIMQKDAEFCEEDYEKVKHRGDFIASCLWKENSVAPVVRREACCCVNSSLVSLRSVLVKITGYKQNLRREREGFGGVIAPALLHRSLQESSWYPLEVPVHFIPMGC